MQAGWLIAACVALCVWSAASFAQTAALPGAPSPAPELAATPAPSIIIPAGTQVEIELTETLSSQTSQQEQLFALRLAAPITLNGREIVPAGAVGGGEVIDAAPSAFGGRPGRLILSGRYLEINGARVRLRGLQMSGAGGSRVVAALTVPFAGFLIEGGGVEIPAGTRGVARLAEDLALPAPSEGAAGTPAVRVDQGQVNQTEGTPS